MFEYDSRFVDRELLKLRKQKEKKKNCNEQTSKYGLNKDVELSNAKVCCLPCSLNNSLKAFCENQFTFWVSARVMR